MAKAPKKHHGYREDLSETPEWLKKKKCPHRDKFLSGKRILPKNLTGKEALPQVVDEVFLAYNSARTLLDQGWSARHCFKGFVHVGQ